MVLNASLTSFATDSILTMSFSLSGQRILLSGVSSSYTDELRDELASKSGKYHRKKWLAIYIWIGTGNTIGMVQLHTALLDDDMRVERQVDEAFTLLEGNVNSFIIDARAHTPSRRDPLWEVPVSEWSEDIPRTGQQMMLLQVRSFLRSQLHKSKTANGTTASPFSIFIIGDRDSFAITHDAVLAKIQRDISSLHQDATVNFVHVPSSGDQYLAKSIVQAIAILKTTSSRARTISIREAAALGLSENNNDVSQRHFDSREKTQHTQLTIVPPLSARKRSVKIALSFDFDALSAFLGTGDHPDNNMSDYSTGIFAGRIGGRRLLRMLQKYQVADQVTWFIPGHTMETFESTVKEIVASGAEIGLHGYAHEGAYQMTPAQERDVLVKCMEVSQRLTGKKVQGYRAPMYQLRETTIELLKEFGFLYDSSLSHHDSQPYFLPDNPPIKGIDFSQPASSWLKPTPLADMNAKPASQTLVEIPTGWNNEDMMALQYFPHVHNSHGHVDARVVEQRWKDIFLWLWENGDVDQEDGSFIFPILMHPDTSGMAHVMGMVDRFVGWLRNWGDSVQFHTFSSIAQDFLDGKR